MRTKRYLFHLNCTTVADILFAWKVLVAAHRNHCKIKHICLWDCVFKIYVVLGEVHIFCSQDWEPGHDCRGCKKYPRLKITHRTWNSNMRNDCDRESDDYINYRWSEDSTEGHDHDIVICSDLRDVGRLIKDAIGWRDGGGFGLGINPTESYCSWSTKQRQFQVKGKVTRMDLKRGCVLSARGAVSLGQGSHTIMTILRKTSTSPGRKGYRNYKTNFFVLLQ